MNFYPAIALTGGTDGALDAIDGDVLEASDAALVIVPNDKVYFYTLDSNSGAPPASPDVIAPSANAGTKRWLLMGIHAASSELESVCFGRSTNDGTWKIAPSGGNLNFERNESGIWLRKGDIRV